MKAKTNAAEAVAKALETKSADVKKHAETPASERKKAGNRKRNGQPTKVAPPEKKAKTKTPSKKQSPFANIGVRVAKYFGDDVFFGTIKRYIEPPSGESDLWHVVYDDDDQEDYDAKDLRKAMALYKQKRSEDKMSVVSGIAGVDAENQAKPKPSKGGDAEDVPDSENGDVAAEAPAEAPTAEGTPAVAEGSVPAAGGAAP